LRRHKKRGGTEEHGPSLGGATKVRLPGETSTEEGRARGEEPGSMKTRRGGASDEETVTAGGRCDGRTPSPVGDVDMTMHGLEPSKSTPREDQGRESRDPAIDYVVLATPAASTV